MTHDRLAVEAGAATLGLWVALLILGLAGAAAYETTILVTETNDWVEHTHEVIERLAAERAALANAQAARLAHGLTGDDAWLVLYAAAIQAVDANRERVRASTADNPTQQRRLDDLAPLIQKRRSTFDAQVERKRRGADSVALDAEETNAGQAVNLQIDALFSDMEKEERRLLALRRDKTSGAVVSMRLIQAGGMVLSFTILVVAFGRLRRESMRRSRSERTAEEGEKSLEMILMSIGDGVIATGIDGRLKRMNRVAEELTGWTAAESMGRRAAEVFRVIDAETRAPIADPVERALRKGATLGSARPWLLVRQDGSEVPVADSCAPVRDAKGSVHGAVLVFRDLAESERAKTFFKALVERSTDGIALTTPDGTFTYASPAGARMLGCTPESVLGTNLRAYLHPDDLARTRGHKNLVVGGSPIAATERHIRRPNGTSCWIEVTSTNLVDDPAVGAIVRNMHDVTERKAAEVALRTSETQFARLADSGLVGISYADTLGNVHDANDAYLRLLGYSRADLRAGRMGWRSMTPPEWKAADDRANEQLKTSGVASPWEKELLRRDGSRVAVLIGAAMLGEHDCIAFVVDLSDRKRAERTLRETEDQLRHAQKMDAVGRLAGGVAHDFNNMLSVILSYSALLLGDLKPTDPMHADVDEIRKAGEQAAALTRQLLMFSRQQVIEPKVVDLNDVVSDMQRMLKRLLGADIDVTVTKKSTARVLVDPSGVEQVVMNLVVNARDAMPTGGQLTIETADVVLDAEYVRHHVGASVGPHVMLAVTDTGAGMDAATQARIFEPFFTTKAKGKGTGLGLSTVFGIAAQSGGSVWVYSEPGLGTTFKVYLPRATVDVQAPTTSLVPTTLCGTETILLVEDEEQVRVVACGILTRTGYKVIEARNAAEALLSSEQHVGAIHLLLSDVVMPQMSGAALAMRLSASRPDMRVLCMSGYTDDSIVRHGVLESHFAFIQKPITPETLTRKVREVLDAPRGMMPFTPENESGTVAIASPHPVRAAR